MEKLDRLGWAAGRAVAAYGVRIGVRATDPALLANLTGWEPPRSLRVDGPDVDQLFSIVGGGASRASPGVKRYHLVYAGSVRIVRTLDASQLSAYLCPLVDYAVAALNRRLTFVRAGVVGWRGGAILLPGSSFSGKSSLVWALLRAGATYYSDEYAVIGRDGRVYPYAKPIDFRRPDGEIMVRRMPAELGATVGRQPLPVRLIVAATYREGAAWSPRTPSRAQALAQLARHAVWSERSAAVKMASLTAAVTGARFQLGERGDADEAARQILSLTV